MGIEEGLTKRAWLHMLAEGGRWSVRDLAMDMGATTGQMQTTLMRMYDLGSVRRHERQDGNDKAITYSVGEDCRLPSNMTLAEVRKALQAAGETV